MNWDALGEFGGDLQKNLNQKGNKSSVILESQETLHNQESKEADARSKKP